MNSDEYTRFREARYCFVPTCKNHSKNTEKTFFTVPKASKQVWCSAVGIKCPKREVSVCEDHLNLEEDVENYTYWRMMKVRPKLKSRLPKSLIRNQEPSIITSAPVDQCISAPVHQNISTSPTSTLIQIDKFSVPVKFDKGVQVNPETSHRTTQCAIYKSKSKKQTLEEVHDEMLQNIFMEEELPSTQGSTTSADISEVSLEVHVKTQTHRRTSMLNLIKKKPMTYLGLPKNYYWLIEYLESNENVKSFHTILTLYKIKNNMPFNQISDIFEISLSTLWKIFFRTLHVLYLFFKQLVFSPNVFDVKRNLPPSFRTNKEYSNVFCLIECFEIEIEKPSIPINQSLTWSQYKNANTLKYLLGVTPDGFVNFVSESYGGRISDANIVEHSGILDVLPPNCTILADRGFKHIESMLNKTKIKLLRPPSVSKDTKLSKKEAIKCKAISSLHIHIERVIRRVRLYKCLEPHSVINNKLIQHADEIVTVACGLVNLQSSIIRIN